jgi:thiol:disulfide interchange protein
MKKILYILVFLVGTLGEVSAQMNLFKGTFEEAMKKAKEEKKELFVDFYTTWCGPCKMMAEQVFPRVEVGEYFNPHFICVQVDAEAHVALAKSYNVTAFPTMLFISREGKVLRRVQGAMPPRELLKEAKIALGEELSFEQLYEKYKKNKKDYGVQQQLLQEAPDFIVTQEGYEREKWSSRITNLFPDYLKGKKLENMINKTDFMLLTLYHPQTSRQDPVFDFVAANFDKFSRVVTKEEVAAYLVGMNNGYIIQLCKKGDLSYKKRLERVNEDLKEAYSGITFGSLTVLDAITLLADATYYLYKHDEQKFFDNMDKYLAGKGDQADLEDYTQPLEDLSVAYNGKLSPTAYTKSLEWITKALEKDMSPELRTRLLIMMAQCFQNTDNAEKAKQCYNQAYLVSAGIENKRQMLYFQQMIQQYMQGE